MTSEKDSNYKQYLRDLPPAVVFKSKDSSGRDICYVGVMLNNKSLGGVDLNMVEKNMRREWNCSLCSERGRKYANYVFQNGPHLCQHNSELLSKYPKLVGAHINECYKTFKHSNYWSSNWTLKIVTESMVDPMVHVGEYRTTGGGSAAAAQCIPVEEEFVHHYIPFSSVSDEAVDHDKYNKTFQRYVPLMCGMFACIPDLKQFLDSIKLFIKIAKIATYGKALLPSAEWIKAIVEKMEKPFIYMNKIEMMEFIGGVICSSPISNDDVNEDTGEVLSYVITFYHQLKKNSFGMLQKACDEKGMRDMMEARFNPLTHMKRTAPLTEKKIQIAEKKLGVVQNRIFTLSEIEGHDDTVTICPSGMSGGAKDESMYSKLRAAIPHAPPPKKSVGGFADRARKSARADFSHITTYRQLIEAVHSGEITELQIDPGSTMCEVYAAKSTIDPSKLVEYKNNEKYLWCFDTSTRKIIHKYSPWPKVTHIKRIEVGIKHNHIFFITGEVPIEDANLPNCYFNDFLNSAYERTCGTVFSAMNKTEPYVGITSKYGAFGLGTSIKDSYNNLSNEVKMRVNGKNIYITISKY